jgi:hypothetical protein
MNDQCTDGTDRKECPNCGEETEFVQFATGKESTVVTGPNAVGEGILELRACNCGTGIENVLTVEKQRSVYTEADHPTGGSDDE